MIKKLLSLSKTAFLTFAFRSKCRVNKSTPCKKNLKKTNTPLRVVKTKRRPIIASAIAVRLLKRHTHVYNNWYELRSRAIKHSFRSTLRFCSAPKALPFKRFISCSTSFPVPNFTPIKLIQDKKDTSPILLFESEKGQRPNTIQILLIVKKTHRKPIRLKNILTFTIIASNFVREQLIIFPTARLLNFTCLL